MLRLTKVNIAAMSLVFKQPEIKVSPFEQLRVNFGFHAIFPLNCIIFSHRTLDQAEPRG